MFWRKCSRRYEHRHGIYEHRLSFLEISLFQSCIFFRSMKNISKDTLASALCPWERFHSPR